MLLDFSILSEALLALAFKETDFIMLFLRSFLRWHDNVPTIVTSVTRLLLNTTRLWLALVLVIKLLSFFMPVDLFDITRSYMGVRRHPRTAISAHTHAIAFLVIMGSVDALILVLWCRLTIILRIHCFANSSLFIHIRMKKS